MARRSTLEVEMNKNKNKNSYVKGICSSFSSFLCTDNQIAAVQPRAMDAAGSLHPCLALLVAAAVVVEALCRSTN